MNQRERFSATMHYQPKDRVPVMDFNFWEETLVIWREQGLPEEVDRRNSDNYFGMDGLERYVASGLSSAFPEASDKKDCKILGGIKVGLYPPFEKKVLADRGDHEVLQQADGVRVLKKKFLSSIPMHEGHLLVDRESWKTHYKPKLDPDRPDRIPENWDECLAEWSRPDRDYPLFLPGGSLYGWIRNWMGVEAVSYAVYDDPAWFEEMVETVADCIIGVFQRVLASGVQFDGCSMWEDMCYNAGPLLSPEHFKKFLSPHYRRITELLNRHGIDIVWVDCDGDISQLVPLWLEAGVNCMMPVEIGTWGADPIKYRRQYGRDLRILGGFDKHILAQGKQAIAAEVKRLLPLIEDGGFIGFCDHRVPPDIPLEDYLFYLRQTREIWAQNVNLKPFHPSIEDLLKTFSTV